MKKSLKTRLTSLSAVPTIAVAAILSAALSGCGTADKASRSIANIVTPYKADIVQGNFVSKEQVQAVKKGMSRRQVAEILGTPLLSSVFHQDRWDYVFTIKRQGVKEQELHLTATFEGNELLEIQGDEMPSELEFVQSIDAKDPEGDAPKLQASPESIEEHLKELQEQELKQQDKVSGVIAPPQKTYPPLEE